MLPLDTLNLSHSWMVPWTTVTICVVGTVTVLRVIRRDVHVRDIPGPINIASWLYGNLLELLLSQPYGKFERQWQETYGSTYRFKGCFSTDLLFTSDPVTLRYILNYSKLFDHPPVTAFLALMLFGKGSLSALRNGGEAHRRIKNAFSPAFTAASLQPYVPVIKNIACKATDKLMQQCMEKRKQLDMHTTIDVFQLIQHVTSDIIGEVGFGHKFRAVETDGGDEVAKSHQGITHLSGNRSKSSILGDSVVPHIPHIILRLMLYLPTRAFSTLLHFRTISEAWATALLRNSLKDGDDTDTGLVGYVARTNKTLKRERLSFHEISRQTPVILVAGQETTANAIAWALYEVAKRPTWQDQIRKEINEAKDGDSNLDKLEYLNAHIKETLRFHPSVPHSERMAFEDTVLPLSQPITTTSGRVITELPIRKGQIIYTGIASYNCNPHVWGSDAHSFDPLRWLDGRCDSESLPGSIGPYSSLATFSGAARSCLGWRLAILEMQVVLLELISKFQFGFEPGKENDVVPFVALTLLPLDIKSGKASLPLLIHPITSL
ncbi:cytochrome P450 [Marasmius fiardii PR-910]|nr:cytochrome P450 [Marasmius fiardii PR-910]